jgi:hypothetical protein
VGDRVIGCAEHRKNYEASIGRVPGDRNVISSTPSQHPAAAPMDMLNRLGANFALNHPHIPLGPITKCDRIGGPIAGSYCRIYDSLVRSMKGIDWSRDLARNLGSFSNDTPKRY